MAAIQFVFIGEFFHLSYTGRSTDSSMKFPAAMGTNGDKVPLCPKLATMWQKFNFRGGGGGGGGGTW